MRPAVGLARVSAATRRPPSRTTKTEPSCVAASSWTRPGRPAPSAARRSSAATRAARSARPASAKVDAITAPVRSASAWAGSTTRNLAEPHPAGPVLLRRPPGAGRECRAVTDRLSMLSGLRAAQTAVINKFLADRGTHLAAMIAYFALLSFVPLLFIALSLLALAGQPSETSYLIEQLKRAFARRNAMEGR